MQDDRSFETVSRSAEPNASAPHIDAAGFHSGPGEGDLFYGPFGLRAGWTLALYLTVTCLLVLILALLAGFLVTRPSASGVQFGQNSGKTTSWSGPSSNNGETVQSVLLNEGVLLLAVCGSTFMMSRLERRSPGVHGLGTTHGGDVLAGALTGVTLLSALAGVLRTLNLLVVEGRLLSSAQAWRSGLLWLLAFGLVGLFEEYFFRGYLQYTLTRGLLGLGKHLSPSDERRTAFWLSAVLLSLVFSLVHVTNSGETRSGIFSVFIAGLVFSYALWHTGSLWWGVGFHTTWDWAQSFLFGVPDSGKLSAGRLLATHANGNALISGGAAGPEGSLFVLPVFLLVVVIIKQVPARPQPPLAPQPAQEQPSPTSLVLR